MVLGIKIKKHMLDTGISETYLSEKTGIKTSTLNQILSGERCIRADEYFVICDALKLPTDYFKTRTG